MKEDVRIDCTGVFCPIPVVRAGLELDKMEEGQVLKVTADDPGAKEDFPAWSSERGYELVKSGEEEDGIYYFYIKK